MFIRFQPIQIRSMRKTSLMSRAVLFVFLMVSFTISFGKASAEPTTSFSALNENTFGPSPLVQIAIQKELPNVHRYIGESAKALVEQIAAKEHVDPDQILLGELLEGLGLYLSLQGGQGGEFIYSVPGYPALVSAAARVGGVVVSVPLTKNLENDLTAIANKITPHTRAVFLVNPHNPSGTVWSPNDFAAFARAVSPRALVIVDEAYLKYTDDFAGRSAVQYTREGLNVIVFRTFAKIHGLAGLPLGYAVAPKAVAGNLRKQGLGDLHSLNRFAVVAAAASLSDEAHIANVREQVSRERVRWNQVLNELKLQHTQSEANFVFFDSGRPHAEIAAALAVKSIAVGRVFPPYEQWVRITIGRPDENARAQAALRAFYNQLQSPK